MMTTAEIQQYDVYPLRFRDCTKYAVRGDNPTGFGDCFFDTAAEAEQYAATERARDSERADREAEAESREQAAEIEAATFRSVGGYTDGMSPMQAQRVANTLQRHYVRTFDYGIITRREFCERLHEAGATVDGDRAVYPDGETFVTLHTAAQRDYLNWLNRA